jgi:hypothetical protein
MIPAPPPCRPRSRSARTPLARFVNDMAASLPCSPDYVGAPMLALLGCAIGTSRVLCVNPGWLEGPRLYSVEQASLMC